MKPHLGGKAPSSASLSQWANGALAPSALAQLAMQAATNGEVSPNDWARWRAALHRHEGGERGRK